MHKRGVVVSALMKNNDPSSNFIVIILRLVVFYLIFLMKCLFLFLFLSKNIRVKIVYNCVHNGTNYLRFSFLKN